VIEDAAQRVIGVLAVRGILNRFADGDAQAAGTVRIFGKDLSSGGSLVTSRMLKNSTFDLISHT